MYYQKKLNEWKRNCDLASSLPITASLIHVFRIKLIKLFVWKLSEVLVHELQSAPPASWLVPDVTVATTKTYAGQINQLTCHCVMWQWRPQQLYTNEKVSWFGHLVWSVCGCVYLMCYCEIPPVRVKSWVSAMAPDLGRPLWILFNFLTLDTWSKVDSDESMTGVGKLQPFGLFIPVFFSWFF